MKTTGNLGLKKPEGTDIVDINDLNGNMDILDTAVKNVQDHTADTIKHITAAERTAWNAKASTASASSSAAGLMSAADKSKLDGVAAGANVVVNSSTNGNILVAGSEAVVYTHPSTHAPSIIVQDSSNRFVSDSEKATWNAKASTAVATQSANGLLSSSDKTRLDNSTGFGTTAGTATAYTLSLSPSPTLAAGLRFSLKAHVASGSSPTLNINSLGAKAILKANGSAASFVQNGVYTLVYDGTSFILQGEGGEYGNATAADVLDGRTIGTGSGLVTGTIPMRYGGTPGTASYVGWRPGIYVKVPVGYYGYTADVEVQQPSLIADNIMSGINIFGLDGTATSDATATSADIAANKSAYVNGQKVWGTLAPATGQTMSATGTAFAGDTASFTVPTSPYAVTLRRANIVAPFPIAFARVTFVTYEIVYMSNALTGAGNMCYVRDTANATGTLYTGGMSNSQVNANAWQIIIPIATTSGGTTANYTYRVMELI